MTKILCKVHVGVRSEGQRRSAWLSWPAIRLLLAVALLSLISCSPPARRSIGPKETFVQQAKADLAEELGIRQDEITVQSVEEAQFLDASLGVPEPGRSYAQVVISGYVIDLIAGGTVYEYHAGDGRVVLASAEGDTGDQVLVVEGVRVDSDQLAFRGSTLLPDGTCLLSLLYVDDEPVSWWPDDECISVEDDEWQIRVPLGEQGAPDELDVLIQYKLRVWVRGDPSVETEFWFDLAGPPSP